jgi:hypothetical protein
MAACPVPCGTAATGLSSSRRRTTMNAARCFQRVDAVYGLDCACVLTDDLLKAEDGICRSALECGHDLWAAPTPLVDAIRLAAALKHPFAARRRDDRQARLRPSLPRSSASHR